MNRLQWITVALAVLNLVLVGLFPPYDYVSPSRNNVPTFDGFYWMFSSELGSRILNVNFLQLEIFVIAINAAIAWLLLRERPKPRRDLSKHRVDWQKVVLAGVALNLVLVLLFPPMENYFAVTRSALPSFDGFYFLFGEHGPRQIVVQLLYIEVIFVLINGAILWLLFRKSGEMTDAQRAKLLKELAKSRK